MNRGQFEAIYGVLCEIWDLLKVQQEKPTIIAIPNDANAVQIMEELNQVKAQPAKRRGRPKKVSK